MKILEKRPLALILCILLGGFSFFADCAWQAKLTIALVSFLAIGVIYTFDNLKHGRKPLVVISLLAFGMSPILSLLWSVSFYPNNIYDTNAQIEAKIYDIDYSSASVSLRCETEKINGKRDKHIFYVYLSKDEATTVRKYDVISFSADVKPLSSSDDGFDGKMYYASNGYSAVCSNVSDLTVIKNSLTLSRVDSTFFL